jgi:hypothetical protein
MLQALTDLQADYENTFVLNPDLKSIEYLLQGEYSAQSLMSNSEIQKPLERRKMKILMGLARLKKNEIRSFLTVLETLYQIFSNANTLSLYSQSQAAVLLTGMGLINVHGRLAFFTAVNRCCATIFELLYHEIEAEGAVPILEIYQPTYGRKKKIE